MSSLVPFKSPLLSILINLSNRFIIFTLLMNAQSINYYIDKIRNAPEQKIVQEIASLKSSFLIFHGNYKELLRFLTVLEDKPQTIALWAVEKREDLLTVFRETGRLLFNYLASAFMLIDHTRRYVDDMYSHNKYSAFKMDYEKEIRHRFADNDNHHIAQGLRNYMQHRKLPSVGSTVHYSPKEGPDKAFNLSIPSLLEWHDWTARERQILTARGNTLPLRDFIQQYFQQVHSFHQWLRTNQVKLHKEDFDRFNQLKREAREALQNEGLLSADQLKEFHISL